MSVAAETDGVRAIHVPREIVNADSVFVVLWRADEGVRVEAGTGLCDVETSKAVVTIDADQAGYVRQTAGVGAEVAVGGIVGYITAQSDTPLPEPTSAGSTAQAAAGAGRISAKARRKMDELGLDPSLFAGRAVVREQDVEEMAAARQAARAADEDPRGPFVIEPLSPIQRRVARVMESAAQIPVSYLERTIDLAPLRERAQSLAAATVTVVTELDLLVASLAAACLRYPRFNAAFQTDHELRLYQQVNVGVAVDVKGDLFVVVLRDAAVKDEAAIARALRGLQYLAQRKRAGVEHLTGGTITVTSMLGRGVQRFLPLVYPEQTAIIGLGDPAPGGTTATLVLGFDHRVSNGSSAAEFLAAVAAGLEGPARIAPPDATPAAS